VLAGGSDLRYGGTESSAVVGRLVQLTTLLSPARDAPRGGAFTSPRIRRRPGWEFQRNLLIEDRCFSPQLGEKPCKITLLVRTLTPRI